MTMRTMCVRSLLAVSLITISLALGALAATAEEFQPDPGFESLFNGRDLTGWGYRATKTLTPGEAFEGKTESSDGRFSVTPGVLVANPKPDEDASRARLWTTREFPENFVLKLEFRASEKADSGLYVRKPQLQVRDYGLAGPYHQLMKYRPLAWNDLVITVRGNVAHATCNGEVLEDAMEVPDSGPLGLESDRGTVEYRHIQLQPLP